MFCCVISDHCHTPRASDVIWAHYAISILCSLQWKAPALLCLHVKVFLPAFCAAFIPLLLTAALIAAWGTVTQTCTHAAAYWPTTLSVENQSRNKKQRKKEGREREKKRCLLVGQDLKRLFFKMSFLWHLSDLKHGSTSFVYVALYGVNQSISLSVFSLPFSQNKQRHCITQQNVSRTNAWSLRNRPCEIKVRVCF